MPIENLNKINQSIEKAKNMSSDNKTEKNNKEGEYNIDSISETINLYNKLGLLIL